MGDEDKEWKNRDNFRRWKADPEPKFPMIPYPGNSKISVKQIAYMHKYCKKTPEEIVRHFPRHLNLGEVHLALAHYFLKDKKDIDETLAAELRVNSRDALLESPLSLPRVGLSSLVDPVEIEAKTVPPLAPQKAAVIPPGKSPDQKRDSKFSGLFKRQTNPSAQ